MKSIFISNFRRPIALGLVFATLLIATFLTPGVSIASGHEKPSVRQPETGLKADFSIENVSPYVVQSSPLNVTIQTDSVEAQVVIEILSSTNTRSDLFSFAKKQTKRRVRDSVTFALSDFTPVEGKPGNYSIDIPVNANAEPSLSLPSTGIYPIAISLSSPNVTEPIKQYSFTTNIPNVGADGSAYSQRLQLVPLISYAPVIDRSKIIDPDGKLTEFGREIQSKLQIAQNSMESISKIQTPFSVVLSPEVFDTYSSIRKSIDNPTSPPSIFSPSTNQNIEFIADTYVPIDFAELEKREYSSAYGDLVTLGRTLIKQAGFTAPVRTLATSSITKNAIVQFARSGIDQAIVKDKTFSTTENPEFNPASLTKDNASIRIASSNTSINENLPKNFSKSAIRNYLVAATSVVALETPSIKRGFILPLDLNALGGETVVSFLNSVTNSPLVKTSTTQNYFQNLADSKTLTQKLSKSNFPKKVGTTFTKNEIDDIQKYAAATQSMFNLDSEISAQAIWQERACFSETSRKISRFINAEKARDLTLSVENYIALPDKRTLTITSRENEIPVTLRNTYGAPISIVVTISSDKLAFPKGSVFPVTLREENSTIKIPVRARTSGSFSVSITVASPNGMVKVGQQSATVRSTVVSGAGIAIAVSSLLFLAVWWASHYRRSKKKPIAPVIELSQENKV